MSGTSTRDTTPGTVASNGEAPASGGATPSGNGPEPAAPASDGATIRAEAARLGSMLSEIAKIGADPEGGVSRLGFTPAERDAHDLVGGWLRDLGLEVRVDAIGNTIAERPGTADGTPAIGIGSHLDSVPHGCRYDGIVGVVGAVETVRLLTENGIDTAHPLRVVIFAGEEGARFGEPCIGSKIVTGELTERDLSTMRDAAGVTLDEALRRISFDPRKVGGARWRRDAWAAFLELHIEQGRVLEVGGTPVGLVDVVSGSTRLRLEVSGRADHSGGTPMAIRADALAAAAEIITHAEALARDPRNRGARLTVGRLEVHPNSITTIPGRVRLTVDVRDVDSDRQRALAAAVVRHATELADRRGVQLAAERIADTSPVVLPIWVRQLVAEASEALGHRYRVMTSGAGHDAQVVNALMPAGIVFVPSKDGVSHVPEEWTSASDIARGVDVLYEAMLRLDRMLAAVGADS